MSNSSVIDGDLHSLMCEGEEEDVENSFFKGESSSLVDDKQYCSNVIGEHVYKPYVPIQFIPFKCLIFESLELVIKLYFEYAEIGGFHVKLSIRSTFDNTVIKKKHVICNRGGKQKKISCDTLGTSGVRRKQNSYPIVTGFQENIIFESVSRSPDYKVFQFDELHNHPLQKRNHLKSETNVMSCGQPKVLDYKNVRRDISRIIGYKDAQVIVNTMNDRRAHYPNYSFEFNCQDDVLESMFWANEMEKTYYAEFGDVISFYATFRTVK
uniref:FAR1 domain-containing protein n=1 Tax=Lactuca sativa TaxID=4236 RepID=A0A9R1VPC0_LACSA|nr:hypothetical protein LSAT_V11C500234280 [Lactuca sativa]